MKNNPNKVTIDRGYYETLMAKAKAHDSYLHATRQMAQHRRKVVDETRATDPRYALGYGDCLLHFSQFIVEAPTYG